MILSLADLGVPGMSPGPIYFIFMQFSGNIWLNKKVLLRERKRHTAHRIAIAISWYSGGGGPLTKIFFFQSEHVSSQIWCQKIFPLLGRGPGSSLDKKFFFKSEHVSSQIWCQKNFPLLGGGSLDKKIFFPV